MEMDWGSQEVSCCLYNAGGKSRLEHWFREKPLSTAEHESRRYVLRDGVLSWLPTEKFL